MRSTLLPLALAAVLAVAGCGTDDAESPGGSSPDESDASSPAGEPSENLSGDPVDADLVLLADSVDATIAPPTVLADPTSTQAYPGWYAAEPDLYRQVNDALAGLPDYPNSSRPVLAFTHGPNCASIDDAALMVDGTKVYAESQGREHEECYAPHTQIAMFSVDRSQLPRGFTLVGTDSSGADRETGPGELLAFQELDAVGGYRPPDPRELTDQTSVDAFASALPSHQATVRDLAGEVGGERRVFGFVVSGCMANTAELVVTPRSVSASPVGGEAVRCIAPVFYVAVFAADPEHLPNRFALR